jgi:hypothetical protein
MARCGKYLMNSLPIYRISWRLPSSKGKDCKNPTMDFLSIGAWTAQALLYGDIVKV